MTLLKTAAGDEQIDIKATPEKASMFRETTLPHGEAQANSVRNTLTTSPIVLTTMPYPASGPGGPSLTSRKH
jgi:hypothetical protein